MKNTKNDFNGVIIDETSKLVQTYSKSHRIYSMLLDHFLMSFLIVPPVIVIIFLIKHLTLLTNDSFSTIIFFSLIFIYINKDFFNAKSPAKRLLGYQVIDCKTEKPASAFQCFIRNLTIMILWPIEVIVTYINPSRRIGDFIANTKVVSTKKEKLMSLWIDLKGTKLKREFIYILLLGAVYFYSIYLIFPI
ncbi:RDD family protein [Kordia sp.]|uniref:RDD family protein n=1 Tax=Kordia sp. TaxID=1965332 RepID=UPI003B5A364C